MSDFSDETRRPLSRHERKVSHEREKILARREQRVTYDLPPALKQRVKVLGEELGIPASQLVTLALIRLLEDLHSGELDLSRWKEPSDSPRYEWNLKLNALLNKALRNSTE